MKILSFIVLVFTTVAILASIGHFLFDFLKETSWFLGNEVILSVLITIVLAPIGVVLIRWDYKNTI